MSFSSKQVLYFSIIFEIVLIVFLIGFSIILSEKSLRDWHGPGGSISTDLYIPSILFACGKGFVNTDPSGIPHLRSFLDFNEQIFLPEYIPAQFQAQDLDIYQQYHRYLIYTVGLVWRIFGVSWEVLRWFLVFLYVLTVLIVYAIARTFLPPYFSIFIGFYFVISGIALIILPILRDFVRAPFILTVILILFYLIQGKRSNKRFLVSCLLLGLICGIGIGFRRDLLMFFILSLFILIIVPKENHIPKIPIRIVGVIITILVFLFSSYPILQSFHKFGTLGWHDILMGFGTEHDDLAGLQRTNYERMPKYNDLLVSVTADNHSYYNESLNDYELFVKKNSELEKRNLFFTYLYWFPADIVIRIYSSIARLSDRILTSTLPINPYRTLLSLVVLIIFMAIDLHKGICFSVILLFAMSIQTLQFNFRHNFYLAFVPYLLYFLALNVSLHGLCQLWKGGKEKLDENIHELKRIFKRFCIIGFTITFFAFGILVVARQIQSYQLTQLFRLYETAERVPVSYKSYTTQAGTAYSLEKPLSLRFDDHFMAVPFFEVSIVVVDFLVNKFPACFEVLYDGLDDFSCNLTITRYTPSDTQSVYVRYFIPVYEHLQDLNSDWNRFIGIRIEDTSNLQVQNIYKICNPEHIPLFINYYFVQDELPNLYQKIAPYSKEMINPCWKPYGISTKRMGINNANNAFYNGDLTKAYEILQKFMEEEPYSIEYGLTLASIYEKTGQVEQAKEIYLQLMSNKPHEPILGIKLNNLLLQSNLSEEDKQRFWKDVISKLQDSSVAWFYYSKSLTDVNTAKEALSKSISLNRDILLSTPYTSMYYDLKELFSLAMKNEQDLDNTLCSTLPLHRQIAYMLTAGVYTADNHEYKKSLDILQFLSKITPNLYLVYPPIVTSLLNSQDADIESIFYYSTTLISIIPYKIEPIIQIEDIHDNIHYFSEKEWIELWSDLRNKTPDSPCILCGLGRAYELSRQTNEAKKIYKKAIGYSHKSEACAQLAYYRLAKLEYSLGNRKEAISLLKKAIRLYPDNVLLKQLLEEYK